MNGKLLVAAFATTGLLVASFGSQQVYAAQSSTTKTKPETFVYDPYPGWLIQLGSRGSAVRTVQQRLNAEGFPVGPTDGDFGPLTLHGVRTFQASHHLVVDGIVGPKTWAALFPPPSSKLLSSVQKYLATRQSDVSVAVYDAKNQTTYIYDPYETFSTASIVKPLILATLLKQKQNQHKVLTSYERELAAPMIELSNNSDATQLWNAAGGWRGITGFVHEASLNQTAPNRYGYWGLTTTSALDEVQLMKDYAYPNHLLDTQSRVYGLDLMHHVVGWERWGVSAGVPAKAYLAIKNGWLPLGYLDWEINSVGYVNGSGRNYVVAVLTRNNPTEQYGITTIQGVSEIISSTFGKVTGTRT